jgi:hypothetical protein
VSEIYGSSGGYDRGDHHGNDASDAGDPWDNYDPDAELEAMGITRQGEWERARTQARGDTGYGDGWADDADETDPDAENDADIYAILHEDDDLSEPRTRQEVTGEAREFARNRDPASTETGTDSGGEAYRSWEDDLPTREEFRAKTWGPDAEYWDENEQAWRKFDSTPTPEGISANTDQDNGASPVGQNPDAVARGDHPYPWINPDGTDGHQDTGPLAADRSADADQNADGSLRQRITDLEAANAELKAANAKLEAENSLLGEDIAELKAENVDLRREVSALDARLERLERNNPDKHAASIGAMECGDQQVAKSEDKEPSSRREWTSNEAVALAAVTGGGVMTTVADYWSYLPAAYAGISASVLGVGAAAIALVRKHREAKNAHRPGH